MVTIEDLTPEHFGLVARWLSRPDTNRWLTSEWRNRDVSPSMLAIAVRNRKNRLFIVKSYGVPIGLVGLSDIDLDDKTAMIWYVLGNFDLSCKGLTSEAVCKLASIAFNDIGLCSLYAWIMENNIASEKVLTKVGFKKAGCIRFAANSSGRQVDRMYFDLTYEESQH
jgi:RimJ/RimL family protein N-acetyltransferase